MPRILPSSRRTGLAPLAAALMGLLLGARGLPAQPMASIFVRPGERVRVTTRAKAPMGATRVGVLHQVLRDSITVDVTGGVRETLPLDGLSRLEVSDGTSRLVARGMGYGALTGAIAGAAYGVARADEDNAYVPPVVAATVMTVVGSLAGTVAGGVVGALGRRERWTLVRLEQPLRRVSVAPYLLPAGAGASRGGMQVGVRF